MGGRLQVIPEIIFRKTAEEKQMVEIEKISKDLRRNWSDVTMKIGLVVSNYSNT